MAFFGFFNKLLTKEEEVKIPITPPSSKKIKVIITEFLDNVDDNSGELIADLLMEKEGLNIQYFKETFEKKFLDFESKNLFDWIDKGQSIVDKSEADIIVWGYREKDKIRLNFQSPNQYGANKKVFISLIDSLYIPADYTTKQDALPEATLDLIYGAILSAANISSEMEAYRRYLLRKTIDNLEKNKSLESLAPEYLPYTMNFWGIIYLSYSHNNKDNKHFKEIKSTFENAIKHQNTISNQAQLGCIYYHLAQLYDVTNENMEKKSLSYFKGAVEYYVQAQKYLSKYDFPYEYGSICYRLSDLYYGYWIQKSDTQALRDAIFQLREAERIYTFALFPEFWASIQTNLGYILSILGNISNSTDISMLAVASYKNKQKVITEEKYPNSWAKTQNDIGDIYYKIGKTKENIEMIEESLDYFHDALYIFEKDRNWSEVKKTSMYIAKSNQALEMLKYKE